MNDFRSFVSRVGVCAMGVVGSLMLAGAARAQDMPGLQRPAGGVVKADPRATTSRRLRAPRNPATGLAAGEYVLSINGDSFGPVDTLTGYGYEYVNNTVLRFPTAPSVGD